jgi:hypothetical protein
MSAEPERWRARDGRRAAVGHALSVAGFTLSHMPKSRGRKTAQRAAGRRRGNPASGSSSRSRQYDVGTLSIAPERIAGLLTDENLAPDLMIELLPPMRWIYDAEGGSANRCVDATTTLRYTYEYFGIEAHVRPVDLVVSDQNTGQMVQYGRPDPRWDGNVFSGHCVLHLPGSNRLIDPTVEQYPEVRPFGLGPICGRVAAAQASPDQLATIRRGGLLPDMHIGVQRGHLMLLYTAVSEQYTDVVATGPVVVAHEAQTRRAGMNLAAVSLDLLRREFSRSRARRAPYPQLHSLLEAAGDATMEQDDAGDFRFAIPGFTGHPLGARLDELFGTRST